MRELASQAVRWISTHVANVAGSEPSEGQGLVEYGLILLLVAVAVVGTVGTFGTSLNNLYVWIVSQLPF